MSRGKTITEKRRRGTDIGFKGAGSGFVDTMIMRFNETLAMMSVCLYSV